MGNEGSCIDDDPYFKFLYKNLRSRLVLVENRIKNRRIIDSNFSKKYQKQVFASNGKNQLSACFLNNADPCF